MLCMWEMMACHSLWRMAALQILQAPKGPFLFTGKNAVRCSRLDEAI